MVTIEILATLGLLILAAPNQSGVPLPVIPEPQFATESWELVSKVALHGLDETRLVLRSQRFLRDGSLVLKLGGEPGIWLFGLDGSRLREWTAPAGHGNWRRISHGKFVGEAVDTLWFLPGHDRTLPTAHMAYRLWRPDGSIDPTTRSVRCRHIASFDGGMWVVRDERVLRLDEAFQDGDPVRDLAGIPLVVGIVPEIDANQAGTLAILEGGAFGSAYAESEVPTKSFRIHLVSPAGQLLRSMELPSPIKDAAGGLSISGRRLMVDSHYDDSDSDCLYTYDLDTLAWAVVRIPNPTYISFGRGNARLFDNGRMLRIFDPLGKAIWTYRAAPEEK